jgi:hypothetical protein
MGLRDTRKRDATGSPSRCGRLGSRYSPSFAKGPPRERLPYGWPPGCRRRKSRGRGPVPHAHSHGTRSALTRADPAGLANPARSFACPRWPPCFGSHLPFHLMARPRRPARRPGAYGDSTTCAKCDVAATAPAMSRTTTKPDVLRHRGRGPSFRDRPTALEATPETRCRAVATTAPTWRSRTWSRCLLPGTAIYQGILVPMRGASVLRPSTQALDGVPCTPASRLGPPLAARLRLTLHSGPSSPVTGRFACFETPPAGAARWRRIRVLPRPPVRDPTPGATHLPKTPPSVRISIRLSQHRRKPRLRIPASWRLILSLQMEGIPARQPTPLQSFGTAGL